MKTFLSFGCALVAALFLTLHPAFGVNLGSDDFESYTVDAIIPDTNFWENIEPYERPIARDETTATPFGTSNQYAELNDNNNSKSLAILSGNIGGASAAVTTFSFDFYDTSAGSTSMQVGYAMKDRILLNSSGTRFRCALNNGTITGLTGGTPTYSLDTAYRLYIILNDTADAVAYEGTSLPAYSADVWIRELDASTSVYMGGKTTINSQTSSYRIGFYSYDAGLAELWVDNVSIDEGIPELNIPPDGTVIVVR